MNQEEISFVRQAVKDHYNRVLVRGAELEYEAPDYEWISYSNAPFSRTYVFEYKGDRVWAPSGIRRDLRYIEKELRYWSTVSPEEETE